MIKRSKDSQTIMEQLGLTELQFKRYKEMFTDNKCKYPSYRNTFNPRTKRLSWTCSDYPWSPKHVLLHLAGKQSLALKPKSYFNCLILDIDNHNTPKCSVEERARVVLRAFNGNPLVYTSSSSNGFRIVYFLDKEYHLEQIERFALRALANVGARVGGGFIEIRANVDSDRLPFGEGSYIVDPFTLYTIQDLKKGAQIDFAYRVYSTERLILPPEYETEQARNVKGAQFYEQTERLLREGLFPGISTDGALWNIVSYLHKTFGFSNHQLEIFTIDWLHNMHNGCSDSINDGDFAKNETRVGEKIRKYDPRISRKKPSSYKQPRVPLSLKDIAHITRLSDDYKTQQRMFGLLSFAKNNSVRLPSSWSARELFEGTPASKIIIPSEREGDAEYWICCIPSRIWRDEFGFTSSKYTKQQRELYELGVVGLLYKGNFCIHRCGCYAFRFKFDRQSPLVLSLDEGLRLLFDDSTLITKYGYYRASKIRKHASRVAQPAIEYIFKYPLRTEISDENQKLLRRSAAANSTTRYRSFEARFEDQMPLSTDLKANVITGSVIKTFHPARLLRNSESRLQLPSRTNLWTKG